MAPAYGPHQFRPLAEQIACWTEESNRQSQKWPDQALARKGLSVLSELAAPAKTDALLTTDLHAGNILRAQREPRLVIDPKPFVGDPAYDVTQHLLNCPRLLKDAAGMIGRIAELVELDSNRIRFWLFARLVAESRDVRNDTDLALARNLLRQR